MAGRPFAWVLPDDAVLRALRAGGARMAHDVELPDRRYLRVTVAPVSGDGEWAALVVVADLTDARRLEDMRRDFVANVSHELRTPLASIKAAIETLGGGALDEPAAAREFLSRADAEVDRMVHMVEELLELSRIESGEVPLVRERVDLGAVAAAAVDRLALQAEKAGVSLALEVASGLPAVVGDSVRLEQAVVNLVDNAVKFTPEGGTVRVRAYAFGGGVVVEVRDSGRGIDPADLPRIFERFYKADRARWRGGSGLGLAVVRHTVEAHGGLVQVESSPGAGSTFRLRIPAGRGRRAG
jgi:two-component system phosphate regulon sensor histidine kinase PhoR